MPRDRRILVDSGDNFSLDGQSWDGDHGLNLNSSGYKVIFFPTSIDTHAFGVNIGQGDSTNPFDQIVAWRNGLISFGPVTSDQINFMNNYTAGEDILGFPGNFISAGVTDASTSAGDSITYGSGVVDFDPPYSHADEIAIFRVTWSSGKQVIFTANDFTITATGFDGDQNFLNDATAGFRLGAITLDGATQTIPDLSVYNQDYFHYVGTAGADNIVGTSANELLEGKAGNDILSGGAGDDTLNGGPGDDVLNGNGGTDTASYVDATAGVKVSLAITTAQNTVGSGTDTLSNLENLIGSPFNDMLTGNTGANILEGGPGNDTLIGGGGNDTASYAHATAAVKVSLAVLTAQNTGGAGTDTLSGIENLIGSAFNDTLTGDNSANVIYGGAGNDKINGGAGVDILYGGTGNDTYTVANSGDQIFENPGEGTDKVSASVSFTLGPNLETLTLTGTGNINGTGNELNNKITGNAGANVLTGGAGADTLSGGDGDDTLVGGTGKDKLTGGNGADQFQFGPAVATDADSITDFTHGTDKLAFHTGDYGLPVGPLSASNLVFGTAATDHHSEFVYDATHKALLWDPDGVGGAAAITVTTFTTVVTLTASDFIILA